MRTGLRKLGRRVLRRARRLSGVAGGPAILMYHRIAQPAFDPWSLAVSPANFDAQMGWLKRRRVVLPLEEFEDLRRRGKLPANAIAVTFDDGYACNRLVAGPIVDAHQTPMTIFLTTGAIASRDEFWWDDLERIVTNAKAGAIRLVIEGVDYGFELGDDQGARAETYTALWRAMRLLDADVRKATLAQLAELCGVEAAGRDEYRAMTEVELAELGQSPWVTFGAHSVTHPALSELSSDAQRLEIETSRDACERLTGARPTMFAYPYGDYSDETVNLVREAGFKLAVTTDAGVVSRTADGLRLPRVQVGDWTETELATALTTAG